MVLMLMQILEHLKINKTIILWIKNYLSEHSQQTVVDGSYSKPCKVTSGVPQGSVLGPLLFLIYTNSLLKLLVKLTNVMTFAFADDIKLASTDPKSLQEALKITETWSKSWKLKLQQSKSEHITFKLPRSPISNLNTYYIDNKNIPHTDFVKDLGIIITSDLKWSSQISKVYTKSLHLVYTVLKSFKSSNPYFYVQLYKTHIRPLLEYNHTIWRPYLKSDIRKLESIQTKFTRRLCQKLNIKFLHYQNRLQILGLETLEIRFIKIDLINTYKILNNIIDLDQTEFFTMNHIHQNYNLRRHTKYLKKPINSATATGRNFFSQRVVEIWNRLPAQVVESKSLPIFKQKLKPLQISTYTNLVI